MTNRLEQGAAIYEDFKDMQAEVRDVVMQRYYHHPEICEIVQVRWGNKITVRFEQGYYIPYFWSVEVLNAKPNRKTENKEEN